MREFVPFVCFAVVAFSGVLFGVTNRRSPASVAAGGAGPSAPAPATRQDRAEAATAALPPPVRLLREFFEISAPTQGEGNDPLGDLHRDLASRGWADAVRFMIVTLSDPVESSADHFDPLLDAVQRGFESERYVIDRHYLPWKDFLDGQGRSAEGEPAYRSQPGVVLFRRTEIERVRAGAQGRPEWVPPTQSRVIVALIVGENPIYGVHPQAFQAALETVAHWPDPAATSLRLQILGPTYSGSAISLRHGLVEWMRHQSRDALVEVTSGSAMAGSNKQRLDIELKAKPAGGEWPAGGALLVNFHSASLSSAELQSVFFRDYLQRRLGAGPDQIVLLTEANTAYGASAREGPAEPLIITYPTQIGRTRDAYERQNLLPLPVRTEGSSLGGVEIRLENNPRAVDLPPTFSPTTAAQVERLLLTLLDAVNREGRHYVGLMGTSVEDRLFLAQLIYYRCPNVRLFCLDNNLLYTHPRYNRYLEGMLVASPYSLYPRHVEGQHDRLTAYASAEANATYIACRAVIRRLRGENPLPIAAEYASPWPVAGGDLRPPVWVVQVGRNRNVPLTVLPTPGRQADDADRDYTLQLDGQWQNRRTTELNRKAHALQFKSPPLAEPDDELTPDVAMHLHGPTVLYRASVSAFSLLVVFAGLGAASLRRRGRRANSAAPPNETLAQYRTLLRIDWTFLALAILAAFLVVALPVVLAVILSPTESTWFDFLTIFVAALAVLGAVVALQMTIRAHLTRDFAELLRYRCRRLAARGRILGLDAGFSLRRAGLWLESLWEMWAVPAAALLLPALALVLFLIELALPHHSSERFFLIEQLASPADRISPLVPLWLATLGYVFIFGVRVLRGSRILGESPHQPMRLTLFAPWRHAAPRIPELRDATRAIEAIDHSGTLVDYWLARLLTPGVVVILAVTFLLTPSRFTTQPALIEWSLRLALLGLALAAVSSISSGLECLRAVERFWRSFSSPDWAAAWGSVDESLRAALKFRLFVGWPSGYVPRHRAADAQQLVELGRNLARELRSVQDRLNADQLAALCELEQWSSRPADDNPVPSGFGLLSRLTPLEGVGWAADTLVSSTEQAVRRLLAPYIAELSLHLLAQLCRRLLGSLVLVILLMLVLESYPFQPERFLIVMQLAFVGAAVAAAAWTYVAVNINATLSGLADERAGLTVDLRLLYESLLFLGVPILTVLSLHFPDFSDYFNSAADAVKGIKF